VGLVNGDDNTIKLGTGVILSAKSESSRGNSLPVGTILMWSGAVANIPDGWQLCNGANNTPDMRDRFVVGAGNAYNPGAIGEPDTHNHRVNAHSGTFTTSTTGNHTHTPPSHWYDRVMGEGIGSGITVIDRRGAPTLTAQSSTNGNHAHTVGVEFGAADTTSDTGQNRPRWYAICFIIKL